jgi:ribosomal protein S18 acetylase RimI-like enzyme
MTTIVVRKANLLDAEWVQKLAGEEDLLVDVRGLFALSQARIYVAPPNLGFLSVWLVQDEMQVQDIAVGPEFRRKGVGRALLDQAISDGKESGVLFVTLEVREHNSSAIGFYGALGFEEVGRRPRYYSGGEAAILLTRDLRGER